MSCYYHPTRDSVSICSACGQPVCAECNYVTGTHPMCRHCWELRISNTRAGASSKPVKTKKPEKKERLPTEKSVPELATAQFIAAEPTIHDRQKVEPPASPVKEMSIPYEPPRYVETPAQIEPAKQDVPPSYVEPTVQAKPVLPAEPLTNDEPKILFAPQELTPPCQPAIDDVRAAASEPVTRPGLKETDSQISHVETAAQIPHAATEQVIYLGPSTYAPPPIQVETEPQAPWSTDEQEIKHEKPKPKLDIGNRARGLFGSLSKLKLNFGGKGKPQEETHYTQVAQQTSQCHQCGAENDSCAPFCQVCGAWFQHHETLTKPQELMQQRDFMTDGLQAAPVEPIMHQAPKENGFQPSHVEPPAQATPTAAESIIYLGPPAQSPQPLYVEPEPQVAWSTDEQEIKHEKPKPKLDIGNRARGLFGSLSKLKLNFGGKGKQQKGPHYVQVAQQTFQCYQCGAENYIGELFCQGCGSWFQYTCPGCGAVVDPSFDSCSSCFTELGWEHTAEEEYHGYP